MCSLCAPDSIDSKSSFVFVSPAALPLETVYLAVLRSGRKIRVHRANPGHEHLGGEQRWNLQGPRGEGGRRGCVGGIGRDMYVCM